VKKKLSKREEGKRLNESGRLSPLEAFQTRLEYYDTLARQEIALGDLADGEKVDQYLRLAQEAGEALAPYRHPRLQATAVTHGTTSRREREVLKLKSVTSTPARKS
jgi:hypothetical protein